MILVLLCGLWSGSTGACAGSPKSYPEAPSFEEGTAELPPDQGAIDGVARDAADGSVLSMVSVQVLQDGKIVAEDMSDHEGKYRVGPLATGYYDLNATFGGARVVYRDIFVDEGQETHVKLQVDLRQHTSQDRTVAGEGARGSITGTIRDGVDGEALPGAVVTLLSPRFTDAPMTIADANGVFRFGSLPPGKYGLSCYYQLIDQGTVEIRRGNIVVEPGEKTDVLLVLDLLVKAQ